mmetsp:Transcript_20413/g.23552  ORF Transcript_20413/g.23552 Transcript_20413/m.23552 type:complete len:87 (-) Transcript_20413:14-274(-)
MLVVVTYSVSQYFRFLRVGGFNNDTLLLRTNTCDEGVGVVAVKSDENGVDEQGGSEENDNDDTLLLLLLLRMIDVEDAMMDVIEID